MYTHNDDIRICHRIFRKSLMKAKMRTMRLINDERNIPPMYNFCNAFYIRHQTIIGRRCEHYCLNVRALRKFLFDCLYQYLSLDAIMRILRVHIFRR